MNLHLQPRQFLFLYNCIKNYEKEYMFSKEEDLYGEVLELLENHILNTFEDFESKLKLSGFDKWVKSESNKIKGLEDELKRIKVSMPQEELVKKFTPSSALNKNTKKKQGRPKKTK